MGGVGTDMLDGNAGDDTYVVVVGDHWGVTEDTVEARYFGYVARADNEMTDDGWMKARTALVHEHSGYHSGNVEVVLARRMRLHNCSCNGRSDHSRP